MNKNIIIMKDFFNKMNNIHKITLEQLNKKDFCALICRHDTWNTRKPIYESLKNIGKIICPSHFENNYDHASFEKLGKNKFLKQFIFSYCVLKIQKVIFLDILQKN